MDHLNWKFSLHHLEGSKRDIQQPVELALTNVLDFSKEKIFEARRSSPHLSSRRDENSSWNHWTQVVSASFQSFRTDGTKRFHCFGSMKSATGSLDELQICSKGGFSTNSFYDGSLMRGNLENGLLLQRFDT